MKRVETAGVTLALAAEAPGAVRGNPVWLTQVFANLIASAIQHSPPGGRVQVFLSRSPAAVQASVTDQGPGIPTRAREPIFEKFHQRGQSPGTLGLGLYLCKRIVELHGGTIRAEDAPTGGARITFQLPLPPAPL